MKRISRWLAFLLIVTMLTAALLAGVGTVMAAENRPFFWRRPPEPANEETGAETNPPEETQPPAEDTVTETDPPEETQPPAEDPGTTTTLTQETVAVQAPLTTGGIEMVVWEDINGNGQFDIPSDLFGDTLNEGIDGIEIELYKEVWDEEAQVNKWEKIGTKKTGPDSLLSNPGVNYKHGCVVWRDLPLDPADPVQYPYGRVTKYKLELVKDDTYSPVGFGGPWIAELHPHMLIPYVQCFLPMAYKYEPWDAPQIQETTATISGFVWSDANADQIIQWSELQYFPLQGWTVMLTNKYGRKIATTTTDVYGYYYFRGLKPGTYKVWVKDVRFYNQVAPYYKFFTWPPFGYNKGHYTVTATGNNRYTENNFGMLDMRDSVWAPLYYALWWIGLLQYQF